MEGKSCQTDHFYIAVSASETRLSSFDFSVEGRTWYWNSPSQV